jgi:hypothetical protein
MGISFKIKCGFWIEVRFFKYLFYLKILYLPKWVLHLRILFAYLPISLFTCIYP